MNKQRNRDVCFVALFTFFNLIYVSSKFTEPYGTLGMGDQLNMVYRFTIPKNRNSNLPFYSPLPDYANSMEAVVAGEVVASGGAIHSIHFWDNINDADNQTKFDGIEFYSIQGLTQGKIGGVIQNNSSVGNIGSFSIRSQVTTILDSDEFDSDETTWNMFDPDYPETGIRLIKDKWTGGRQSNIPVRVESISVQCEEVVDRKGQCLFMEPKVGFITLDRTSKIGDYYRHQCKYTIKADADPGIVHNLSSLCPTNTTLVNSGYSITSEYGDGEIKIYSIFPSFNGRGTWGNRINFTKKKTDTTKNVETVLYCR